MFLLVWLCALLFSTTAFAAEPVTVNFVNGQNHTQSEGASFDQNGYLYFNQKYHDQQPGTSGAWVEFPIEGVTAGTYKAILVYKTHENNGVFQVSIDGTNIGNPIDGNAANAEHSIELGEVTIADGESHAVKLTALESTYGKYRITVKTLTLTPVDPTPGGSGDSGESGGSGDSGDSGEPGGSGDSGDSGDSGNMDFGTKQTSDSGNVAAWPRPIAYEASTDFTSVTADGLAVPTVKYDSCIWYDYANFSMKGSDNGGAPVTVEITYKDPITSYDISPKKLGMTGTVDGNKLTLTLTNDEYLIIRINGQERRLVLLADPWETDIPASSGEGIFNVLADPYNADRTGKTLANANIQQAIDAASAYGTEHGTQGIVYIPNGVYQISTLDLKSNVGLYLEGGAALRLTEDTTQYRKRGFKNSINKPVLQMLHTYNNTAGDPYANGLDNDETYESVYQNPNNWVESSNIKIYGRGTIDGRGAAVDAQGWLSETLVPQNCANFTSDGIIYRESGVWSINVMSSHDLEFTNLKVLNTFLHENDCIDVVNSQNVTVRNAFGCALDDPYSTKTFQRGELFRSVCGDAGELKNVTFDDCIAWTCCYGFKVGQGSVYTQDNVTFKNGVVYECSVGVGIEHKYGDAELKNITFENIDIEHVGMTNGAMKNWLAFQCVSGSKDGTQPLSNITLKDINVRDYGPATSRIVGYDKDNMVNGITFENITTPNGSRAATLQDLNITDYYLYANGITIDGAAVQDAPCPVTIQFDPIKDQAVKSNSALNIGAGESYVYYGSAVGDWITFPIQVDKPGTYKLEVIMKRHPSKGIFQTYVNDTAIGEPVDEYAANNTDKLSIPLGEVTFDRAGTQNVKFEITDKNPSSGGYQMVLNGISLTMTAPHEHQFGGDWQKDENGHWQVCSCGENSAVAAHTAGEWIVDAEPTNTQTGSRHKACTVCGYTMQTEEISVTAPVKPSTPSENPSTPSEKPSTPPETSPKPAERPSATPAPTKAPESNKTSSTNDAAKANNTKPAENKNAAPAASAAPAAQNRAAAIPQTGDNSNPALLIVLMSIAGLGLVSAVVIKKKRQE